LELGLKLAHIHRVVVGIITIIGVGMTSFHASAVSVNVGWHNPPNSTVGLNFLWLGSKWGFELGVGHVRASSSENSEEETDAAGFGVSGAMSGKYLFSGGTVRPFAQLGIGLGLSGAVGDNGGASAGAGGLYGGLGVMLGSEKFYAYGSGNLTSGSNAFAQFGIGFGI
jgi:hypothetical protein